jgi:hypothetical protein
MTRNVIWQDHEPAFQPVDETVDHVRGSPAGRLILEYSDYECPYSRQAFRAIERVEQELGGGVRSATTHRDRIAENGPDLRLRADRRGTLATGSPGPAPAAPGTLWNTNGGETPGSRHSQVPRSRPVQIG